jgi:iron complex outermembrane receptor protein
MPGAAASGDLPFSEQGWDMPKMKWGAACALCLAGALPARAETGDDIVVTANPAQPTSKVASVASIDAATIAATVNATNIEDALKYLPSLLIRKRHIGDTQAPLATRTSGLGSSARSLIYADGALLSALIGNNNTTASPRWSLVSPQEVARIDVLYGPFAAAFPGNSIGAVVTIITRLPDRLEATASSSVSVERFALYGQNLTLPAYQIGGTVGDRFGKLALFASVDHVASHAQPLGYATATIPAGASAAGTPTIGGTDTLNRAGAAIKVLGATSMEHQTQDRLHLKAALLLDPMLTLSYSGALYLGDTNAGVQSFLSAAGAPAYAGSLNIGGKLYTVAPSSFDSGVYVHDERHWSHALSASGDEGGFGYQIVATRYRFDHDSQRTPTGTLPAAFSGGAGNVTRLDGTGWDTFDANAHAQFGTHRIAGGGQIDRFILASNRYAATDWRNGSEGALNLQSAGRTRTGALWIEDGWAIVPALTLTVGVRQEWWRAFDGVTFSTSPAVSTLQPARTASGTSPKAALAWSLGDGWTARGSFGIAYRFPTVAELYQVVTVGVVGAIPNPNLNPERARSAELALEHKDAKGVVRVALFGEWIHDALISQTGAIAGGVASFVQNVDATRARGAEVTATRDDVLPGWDLSGSVTYSQAITTHDAAFPAAEGKTLPQVPRWKATGVLTWHPAPPLALTAAVRYASRMYGTIDNSDPIGFTYQGFGHYLIGDLRAVVTVGTHMTFGLGVDNFADQRYFLFHPFPGRTFHLDLGWKL